MIVTLNTIRKKPLARLCIRPKEKLESFGQAITDPYYEIRRVAFLLTPDNPAYQGGARMLSW